jgi:hypothetical protein
MNVNGTFAKYINGEDIMVKDDVNLVKNRNIENTQHGSQLTTVLEAQIKCTDDRGKQKLLEPLHLIMSPPIHCRSSGNSYRFH